VEGGKGDGGRGGVSLPAAGPPAALLKDNALISIPLSSGAGKVYPGADTAERGRLPGAWAGVQHLLVARGRREAEADEGEQGEARDEGSLARLGGTRSLLRHMRHQERVRAVGTHYGPTRIYGPTGHAIGGTHSRHSGAYQPLLPPPGLSDDYGPAASCRRIDLAAAAGARATRMSLLWAGWSSWRTRAGATPRYGTDDYATAGSGPTRQSVWSTGVTGLGVAASASRRSMCRIIVLTNLCSVLPEASRVTV
jgi:hypothetical protein